MEINLLPRKGFVEKRFFFLSFILLLLLGLIAYGLWYMYLMHNYEKLTLQYEVLAKKTEKTILLDNLGWNEEVKKYEVQVQDIKRYQLLIDGLQMVEVDWTQILTHIRGLLPITSNSIAFTTQGNYLSGTVQLNDLQSAATFIEKLKTYEKFHDVYIDLIELPSGIESLGYQVHFSAYLNLLTF